MSSVIWRNLWAMSLPKTMASGVSSNRVHANRSSNQRISRKAPQSWVPVITIWGSVSLQTVLICSMSLANRELTSPECSSSPVYNCRRKRLLKIVSRRALDCLTPAEVVSQ